ncbi:MAG: helix-turn-helix domain-containing protein [Bacteroidota bacterium]
MTDILKILKPLKTKKEYTHALAVLEKHFDAKPGTKEGDLVYILSVLIEKYEEQRFLIESPDPVEAIKFRMEQLELSNKDIAEILGSKSRASEVLNRKRPLTIDMIRALHHALGVPAESLLGAA